MNMENIFSNLGSIKTENTITIDNNTLIKLFFTIVMVFLMYFVIKKISNS